MSVSVCKSLDYSFSHTYFIAEEKMFGASHLGGKEKRAQLKEQLTVTSFYVDGGTSSSTR